MNTINFLNIHTLQAYLSGSQQALQSIKGWVGHAVSYIQGIPQALANNPNALIATIAIANALFFFTLNASINYIEKKITNQKSKDYYKIILISELCAAASVWGFNIFLSKVTQTQLSQQTIAAITIFSFACRMLFKRGLFLAPQQEEEQETPQVPQQIDSDFNESLHDTPLEQQGKLDSPIVDGNATALLRKELEVERIMTTEAAHKERKLTAKILDLEGKITALTEQKETSESQLKIAESTKKEATQKLLAMEKEIQGERKVADKEKLEFNLAKKKIENELDKEKEKFKSTTEALQQTIVDLTRKKTVAEQSLKDSETNFAGLQNTHDAMKNSHKMELSSVSAKRDQALEKMNLRVKEKIKIEEELNETKEMNKSIMIEKRTLTNRIKELEEELDEWLKKPDDSVVTEPESALPHTPPKKVTDGKKVAPMTPSAHFT